MCDLVPVVSIISGTDVGKDTAQKLVRLMLEVSQLRVRKEHRERITELYSKALYGRNISGCTVTEGNEIRAIYASHFRRF
jgi:hypothetical protein